MSSTMKTHKNGAKLREKSFLDSKLGGKQFFLFFISRLPSLIYNFVYLIQIYAHKEKRKEKINEIYLGRRLYRLSRPGNQLLMRPTELSHKSIKRRAKRGRAFLIERSTRSATTWQELDGFPAGWCRERAKRTFN